MRSIPKINLFTIFLVATALGPCIASARRVGPRRRGVPPAPSPSTSLSLKDAANAILGDAKKLSTIPEDLINFVKAVEDRIDSLEAEVRPCSTVGSSSSSPIPSVVPSPVPSITSSLIPGPPQYPSSPVPSSGSTTSTSTITLTSTLESTVFVYASSSHATLPATTNTSSSVLPGFTNATYSSKAQGPLWNTSSTLHANTTTSIIPLASNHPPLSPSSPLTYTFNPKATDNVAVYYGQTSNTTAGGLLTLCNDPSVDILILAFLYEFFGPNGYPSAEFGPGCSSSTPEQIQSAPGLLNCSQLAAEISQCQKIGKPVLLSLGGSTGITAFSSDNQAASFASTVWNLFGRGSSSSSKSEVAHLRPFGDVILDGFDIDNEDANTAHYDVFASALRSYLDSDSSRTYYISAVPQCPRPDASIPLTAMQTADFVWVQFYNNPPCNLGTGGFLESFQAWSSDLAANTSAGSPGPRLFIGGGAWPGAGSGYVKGSDLPGILEGVKSLNVPNLGGMMFWDGTEGLANTDASGMDYLDYAKQALSL